MPAETRKATPPSDFIAVATSAMSAGPFRAVDEQLQRSPDEESERQAEAEPEPVLQLSRYGHHFLPFFFGGLIVFAMPVRGELLDRRIPARKSHAKPRAIPCVLPESRAATTTT